MNIATFQNQNCDTLEIENSVLAGVESMAEVTRSLGHPCKAFSKKSLAQFCDLSEEKKQKILEQTAVMHKLVIESGDLEIDESVSHEEWPVIQKSLDFYGLHLKDDFQKILKKDDVIEVYSSEHIQLFRTFNFYKYSDYSYLDLLINEWYHLWERSSSILEALFAVGKAVVAGESKGLVSMDHVPEHVYKEIHNSEDLENFESRSVLCKFGHISPLYKSDNSVGGFIINCRVKVLDFGEEIQKLSFI